MIVLLPILVALVGLYAIRRLDRTYRPLLASLQRLRSAVPAAAEVEEAAPAAAPEGAEGPAADTAAAQEPVAVAPVAHRHDPPRPPVHPLILSLIDEYERVQRRQPGAVNVEALVAKSLEALRVSRWVGIVRMAVSTCVVFGLLGTLIGLIAALSGIQGALQQAAAQSGTNADMLALVSQLRELLGGMGTAFRASLFGVGGSAVLTVAAALAGTFTIGDRVAVELEHYLCSEHVPSAEILTTTDLQRRLVERMDALTQTLEVGLASGMADAARQFSETSRSMSKVLRQVEPVTNALGHSGQSLETLSQGMLQVTDDMRSVMTALRVSQESVPQRMEELRKVEEILVSVIGGLHTSMQAVTTQNTRVIEAIDIFQHGTHTFEHTLTGFRSEWPAIIQEFATRTEQAVEHNSSTVTESIERLREILEQGHRDTLEQMEGLVTANQSTAQAVATSLLRPGR